MQPKELARRLPAILLASWLIPGAGHWMIGHRRRAVFLGIVLLVTFLVGFWMGGFRNVSYERFPISFAGQAGMGSTWLVGWLVSEQVPTPPERPKNQTLGTLYTAVASLLNLLCVLNVYERVVRMNLTEEEKKQGTKKEAAGTA